MIYLYLYAVIYFTGNVCYSVVQMNVCVTKTIIENVSSKELWINLKGEVNLCRPNNFAFGFREIIEKYKFETRPLRKLPPRYQSSRYYRYKNWKSRVCNKIISKNT